MMKLKDLKNRYDSNLQDASNLLNHDANELVSLKIRPINNYPRNDDDEYRNSYVYSDDYDNIDLFLSDYSFDNDQQTYNGNTRKYSTDDNEYYLFVKHETGPEIIASLALITVSLTLAKSIIELITQIIKNVNQSNEKKKNGSQTTRYHEAEAIIIEKRTKKETKSIKIIRLPSEGKELSIQELQKHLDEM